MTRLAIARSVADLRAAIAGMRALGKRIAFVPTMGALHAGHLSLVARGRAAADAVVASIFVNPKQFGPAEDFDRYPRNEAADVALLEGAGCDLLFAPGIDDIYPAGFATEVRVGPLGEPFEGAIRPGHFTGVATVVARLLLLVSADVALFGEKDWQQLVIIRRMVADLAIPTAIEGCPIVREADGLAMSSRNAYLSAAERTVAAALPRALEIAADAIEMGADVQAALAAGRARLLASGFEAIDYFALADPDTLAELSVLDRPARLLAAARLGTTRLLDNREVRLRGSRP
ncbi:pantoate--beta-alanine ligase [Thermaurantiacus sp.]